VYTAGTVTFAGLVVVFFLASEMSVSHTFLATSDVLSKRHPYAQPAFTGPHCRRVPGVTSRVC